jgi:hypothetical protein
MEVNYIVLQSLKSADNTEIIEYLDKILNHRVNPKVWDWEFNSIENTIFTVAKSENDIAGTQSMLPILLSVNGNVAKTAKSETSYLDANYRGKQIFEKLYQLAVDETVKNGSKIIWGFTPALKAWKKNLGFETFDAEMKIATVEAHYFSFLKNYKKSRNIVFAAGKYCLSNLKTIQTQLLINTRFGTSNSIEVSTQLNNDKDINELYSSMNNTNGNIIHIDLNKPYLYWRLYDNPVMEYRQFYFYQAGKLVGYIIYSIKNDILSIADMTCNFDDKILQQMLKYLISNTNGYHIVQYWGNDSNEINKKIFSLFSRLKGNINIDNTRNFVYKVFDNKYTETTAQLKNWYINGLWTEGFHI